MRILALIAVLAATPATAQSISAEGTVGFGLTSATDEGWIGPADVTFAVPLSDRVDFEFGAFGYMLPGKRPHETYVALRWDNLRLGVVRPPYDAVLPSVFDEIAPHLAYDEAETTRAYTTTSAMRTNTVPVGLSYIQQDGALWWGLSVHGDAKGDFTSFTVAARWTSGPWEVAGAVEVVRPTRGAIRSNAKLGVAWQSDRLRVGLTGYQPDASDQPEAAALDITYAMRDDLTFYVVGEAERGSALDAAGIGARWEFAPASTLTLGATRRGGDDALHLTMQRRF